MLKFVTACVFESTRSLLALLIAAITISAAVYVGTHPFGHFDGDCYGDGNLLSLICVSHPVRLAWQTPVAVAIGVVGLVPAAVIATWRRTRRRPQHALAVPAQWR